MITAAARYSQLEPDREPYLQSARDCAAVTIPTLLFPEGWSPTQRIQPPYQSTGARGVGGLSSKLFLALFPPSHSFFRLLLTDTAQAAAEQSQQQSKAEAELLLAEKAAHQRFETSNYRPYINQTLRQLLVAGNCLTYYPKDGGAKVYRLDSYVVTRTSAGRVLEVVIKETTPFAGLDEDVKALVSTNRSGGSLENVDVFTSIKLDVATSRFTEFKEVVGQEIPGTRVEYKETKSPWLALRLEPITGQAYSFSYVEHLLGDLLALEALTKAVTEGVAVAARMVGLVRPGGITNLKALAEAANGSFVPGLEEDVVMLSLGNKAFDLRVASDKINEIETRLDAAFLHPQAVQRQAERVTAEEIRLMAQELESVLAGSYSLLTSEFQLPLVRILLHQLASENSVPDLAGIATPAIVTGLDALGRGTDLSKLDAFIGGSVQTAGPEALGVINLRVYMQRRANALGLDVSDLLKSEEQLQQEQAQAQQMAALQSIGPEALRAATQGGAVPA